MTFEWLLFFIWPNLNPLLPRMLSVKFDWNPSSNSREDFVVCSYLPLEKGLALHMNNFETPSPKDALC